MSPIAIRQAVRRSGRRLAGLLALVAVVGAVCVHHSGIAMGDMQHEGGASDILELCLGVLGAVGATVVAITIGVLALGRWQLTASGALNLVVVASRPPPARSRAGPPTLAVLCVRRR